jgi:hypothetical protein
VRANTVVREPPKPSALRHQGLEMRDAIPSAMLPPSRLQLFQADLRADAGPVQQNQPKSASLTPLEEFYAGGKIRQLDNHREIEEEEEFDEEGGDTFPSEIPKYRGGHVSAPSSAQPKGKSASVFGSFNPLVVGLDPASRVREEESRMTREQSMLRPTSSRIQGGVGVHAYAGAVNPLSLQQQHYHQHRVLTSPLPAGLSSPPQSPELIEALDSVPNLGTVPFEDSEDSESDNESGSGDDGGLVGDIEDDLNEDEGEEGVIEEDDYSDAVGDNNKV